MATAKPPTGAAAPTMIVPSGAEIEVDGHGQLSIRTPGNLVIQNSGRYANLESESGSIRIESQASIEAVSVRCAETCFVEGSLTAWKVTARAIHLEDRARANIVLQETERLEIGREARLVGNFASENELFVLFSRFAQQLRALPFFGRGREPRELAAEAGEGVQAMLTAPGRDPAAPARPLRRASDAELPDPLFFAMVLLEREEKRSVYGPTSRRAIGELVKLLHERDLETLGFTHRTLFGRIVEPGPDARRARSLVEGHYEPSHGTAG